MNSASLAPCTKSKFRQQECQSHATSARLARRLQQKMVTNQHLLVIRALSTSRPKSLQPLHVRAASKLRDTRANVARACHKTDQAFPRQQLCGLSRYLDRVDLLRLRSPCGIAGQSPLDVAGMSAQHSCRSQFVALHAQRLLRQSMRHDQKYLVPNNLQIRRVQLVLLLRLRHRSSPNLLSHQRFQFS